MAARTTSRIVIAAPRPAVMAVIADFAAYPLWASGVRAAEVVVLEDGRASRVGRCAGAGWGRCLTGRGRLGRCRAGRWRLGRSRAGGREATGTRARLGAPAIGSGAAATRRSQCRLKDRHRILDHAGQRVAHGRYPDIPGGLGLTDEPGGTAQRAPGTLRRLTGQGLGGGGLPHVAGLLGLAQGRADLVGQFPAHPAGTSAQQPTLEVTDHIIARPALLCHLLSSPPPGAVPGRLSTRSFSPLRAVSMIVFSARRFSIPGIGIRKSTESS